MGYHYWRRWNKWSDKNELLKGHPLKTERFSSVDKGVISVFQQQTRTNQQYIVNKNDKQAR